MRSSMTTSEPEEKTTYSNMATADSELPKYAWLVRPCEIYKEEYKDCNGFRGHFNQYFVHGTILDCQQWKQDHDDCMKWRKHKDLEALTSVIESEKIRIQNRQKATLANDIWIRRTKPMTSEEWNRPLPEWMAKEQSTSYLQIMKMKSQAPTEENKACTIL